MPVLKSACNSLYWVLAQYAMTLERDVLYRQSISVLRRFSCYDSRSQELLI